MVALVKFCGCNVGVLFAAGFVFCFFSDFVSEPLQAAGIVAIATPLPGSSPSQVSQSLHGAQEQQIRIAVPKGADPYNLFETEIVAASLKLSGISVASVVEVPNLRTLETVSLGLADLGTTVFYADEKTLREKGLSFTGPLLPCPVAAISLNPIPEFEAIKALRVEAHQGADVAYGLKWKELARPKVIDGSWRNVSDQNAQVRMLFAGRTDLILVGQPIFQYMWHLNQGDPAVKLKAFVINANLQPEPVLWSGYVSHNPELVAKLKEGFKAIGENGVFEKISKRYNLEGNESQGLDFKAIQAWRSNNYEALVRQAQPGPEAASAAGAP